MPHRPAVVRRATGSSPARRTARGVDAARCVVRDARERRRRRRPGHLARPSRQDFPVPDGPVLIIPGVNNNGATDATNVVLDVTLPAGASVADLPPECATSPGGAACSFELISAGSGFGVALFLTFAAPGTYSITSTARRRPIRRRRRQQCRDSTSSSSTRTPISSGASQSRLASSSARSPRSRVFHDLRQRTVRPQAARRFGFRHGQRRHDRYELVPRSSRTGASTSPPSAAPSPPTTFTCAPVSARRHVSSRTSRSIFYDVILPTMPTVVVGAATLTGRADPDTSQQHVDLHHRRRRAHGRDLRPARARSPRSPSGVPFRRNLGIFNAGELAAQQPRRRHRSTGRLDGRRRLRRSHREPCARSPRRREPCGARWRASPSSRHGTSTPS